MACGNMRAAVVVIMLALASLVGRGGAQVHHVVGADQGWDPSSRIQNWSRGRAFRVGDYLWFAYSAALESVVELSNKDEYESCDVSNPIRMYTDGLNKVTLDKQGPRYFVSARPESCKNGLKLNVDVLPSLVDSGKQTASSEPSNVTIATTHVEATGPTPSASAPLVHVSTILLCLGMALLCSIGF